MNENDARELKSLLLELERQREDERAIQLYEAVSDGLNQPSWSRLTEEQKQMFRNAYEVMVMAVDEMGRETIKRIMGLM